MGLYRFKPPMSGRMGTLWTLSSIRDAALVEYGCMGHMLYGRVFLNQAGVSGGCKLYSTHIDETDISLGDTTRLSRTIAQVAERDRPRVIFLLPSSVPTIIGTDLKAICEELQPDYPDLPLLPFGCGGFKEDGYQGVEQALLLLAKTMPKETAKTVHPTFNLIGSCADMFRFHADAAEVVRILQGAFGMQPLCVMTSDTSVEQLEQLGGAHVNLVLRQEGEKAAKELQNRFGIPYLLQRPYGIEGTVRWLEDVAVLTGMSLNKAFVQGEQTKAKMQIASAMPMLRHMIRSHPEHAAVSAGGHADVVGGILHYATQELGLHKGSCWCDTPRMATQEVPYLTETEWTQLLPTLDKTMLMASGEALKWADGHLEQQIANPDIKWRLNPYEPPLMGFHGAVNLTGLWLNAVMQIPH